MFGKKKNKDGSESPADAKPVDKPSKNKSKAKGSFDAKEFMLFHAEKFVFALIALLSAGLVYLGFSTKGFDSNKEPKTLADKSQQVLSQIRENHWDAIKDEEARVKGITDVSYTEKSVESTKIIPKDLYRPEIPLPGSRITGYRADPEILPAKSLIASYFYGPIVVGNANQQLIDFLEKLPDAKGKEEPKRREDRPRGGGAMPGGKEGESGPPGFPGGGPPGFGGPPGMGGPPGGLGGFGGPSANTNAKRFLAPGYDQGFASQTLGPSNEKDPKRRAIGPRDLGFVAITAIAPHEDLEKEYRSKLSPGGNLMPGRDTPNYVGFEVERVDVTEDPNKVVADGDWQALPNAGSDRLAELAKNVWLGTAQEVAEANWTTPNLTIPVPPILIKNYRSAVGHPDVPSSGQGSPVSAGGAPGGMGGMGGMMGGFGGLGLSGGGAGNIEGESGSGEPESGGTGASGGSPPAGYGGGGPPSGYSGGAGPGGGGPPSGYGGGGPPGGLGMGGGPGGMSFGGMGGGPGAMGSGPLPEDLPKELPSTKYKLVRFYDFEAKPNRVYRYRVRLLMYDPNFPNAASVQPRSALLDSGSGTLKRVQDLLDQERKDKEAFKPEEDKDGKKTVFSRKSSRKTAWSEPSDPISTQRVAEAYMGETSIAYAPDPAQKKLFEVSAPKAEMVFAEYDPKIASFLPRKDSAVRGYVFGLPNREGGKDQPIELIHPISKIIKAVDKRESRGLATVVDIHGMVPLETKPTRDPNLKTGAEGFAIDPETGRIIVLREFDDFTNYAMYTSPDKPAVGPLGGPMKLDGGGGMPGMGGPGGGPMGLGGGPGLGGPGGGGPPMGMPGGLGLGSGGGGPPGGGAGLGLEN